ncbi:hypothetical protein RND81_01G068100 [Saponaria officinalis]|uniref:COP1-interacting protein 7 n=3 Tax=Saponaria officinalis TaxID=3572 RepID=A0AAW1NDI0_SAPOF
MQFDVPLDYAVFQLSPRRSRCELFVSYDGTIEKLASGLVKPFVTHLKAAEEQVESAGKSIKLDVKRCENAETWFTKGTLERFVRFVSTPEILEMVATFDAEMSQLEAARKIYFQGVVDHESDTSGGIGNGATMASDATKKELLRAIDVRLSAVKKDLTAACSRAFAAGFNSQTISELQFFADHFGAYLLREACSRFITVTQQRSDLFNSDTNTNTRSTWRASSDSILRSTVGSEMSLDEHSSPTDDVDERENIKDKDVDKDKDKSLRSTTSRTESASTSIGKPQLTRRLSVQERISLFENKAQNSPSSTTTTVIPTSTGGKPELRQLSSDANSSTDKAVLRRWSGASDMSIDVSGERKEPDSIAHTPTPSSRPLFPPKYKDPIDRKSEEGDKDSKLQSTISSSGESCLEDPVSSESNSKIPSFSGRSSEKDQSAGGGGRVRSRAASFGGAEDFSRFVSQPTYNQTHVKSRPGKIEQFCSPIQCATEEKLETRSISGTSVTESEGEVNGDLVQVPRSDIAVFQSKTVEGCSDSSTSEAHIRPEPKSQSLAKVEKVGVRKESGCKIGGGQMALTGKSSLKNQESLSTTSTVPIDKVQGVRQAKGNQGVNDELKMKAYELEKLFAEHKLRVPGDQSNSASRVRPSETAKEVSEPVSRKRPTEGEAAEDSGDIEKLYSTPMSKTVDNQDYDVTPKHNIYSRSVSDDSRGKLYQNYMQKRDAKLREDWSSNKLKKEAQMKAIHDRLEKSRAEMAVKWAYSAEKTRFAYDTRQRAEKIGSKRDQHIDTIMSNEDEGQGGFFGKKISETYPGNSPLKSAQGKKVQPNKNALSPGTRKSTAAIPRSSGKATNSGAGRRRLPYANPLAQSVPNFSDLRKENTRPSSDGSKPVRLQGRNHARKKSSTENLPLLNEEKSRRFQSLRKRMATTIKMNDSRDFVDAQVMPSKYHGDEDEKISDAESNTLPKRGNCDEHIAARNGHGFGDTHFGTKETKVVKNEEHEYEPTAVEESTYIDDDSKERLSLESDKSGISEYESNSAVRHVPQAGSIFRSMGSTLESPGESPVSWNLRLQNPFAFAHEISDIDASDSQSGSPASWNFRTTLSQSETEAARMRKKWGAAQKPTVGVDTSHSPSRKDLTRGLKRLLKFGRKNRCSESMADWISATTSEGDDSEDGRDLGIRSSEDLRKTRMGFSHSHNSDEAFTKSELFNEQVQALRSSIPNPPSNFKMREEQLSGSLLKAPKSFFSLSNFRSKGNDSKPR